MVGVDDIEKLVRMSVAIVSSYLDHHHKFRHFMRSHTERGFLDHVAIKVPSETYEATHAEFVRFLHRIGTGHDDGRAIAGFELYKPILTKLGDVGYIELMQPRPGSNVSVPILDHVEFYLPRTPDLYNVLHKEKIESKKEHNSLYRWAAVPIGNSQELRFSNKRLREIIEGTQVS